MELFNLFSFCFVALLIFLAVAIRFALTPAQLEKWALPQGSRTQRAIQWVSSMARPEGAHPRLYWVLFTVAILVATGLRVYQFGGVPAGFNQDGAMAAVDAKALSDYGTDRFGMKFPVQFTAWGYGQMSVLLSYAMVPFIKVFGLTAITARLPMLFASLLGLVALFFLIKDLAGRRAALVLLFFAAINPWHIMQSRWALDCNMFPHMLLIGLFLLNRMNRSPGYLYASMIFFALCMYSYGIAFVTIPLFLLATLVFLLFKRMASWRQLLIASAVYIGLSWPVWLVMVINTLKLSTVQTPFFTAAFFENSVRSKDLLFFADDFWSQLLINVQSLLNVVFLQRPDLPWNALDNYGTIYLCSMPFVWVGLLWSIKEIMTSANKQKQFAYSILMFGFLTGIWAGLVVASVNVNRINIIFYVMIILGGLGIYQTIRWFRCSKYLIAVLYAILLVQFSSHYFGDYADQIGEYYFEDFGKALNYVEDKPFESIYVTVNSQYEGSKNVSEILTLFHHGIDAQYFQGVTNQVEGKTLRPYSEKYRYASMRDLVINPSEQAVYVVNSNEVQYFDPAVFHIEQFPRFSAVIPRNMQN